MIPETRYIIDGLSAATGALTTLEETNILIKQCRRGYNQKTSQLVKLPLTCC
jgi:hypothetical protein